jgi:2-polyprenyl-6-methoxyphenol hydroxylase-like FAD-dependent oxidoreductase
MQAVVIGSSIAGMLAARILVDYCDSVSIVESDALPETPQVRRGVPQSPQPHVLFAKGFQILEKLFPGIGNDLEAAGAIKIDWAREFHHFDLGAWNRCADVPSEIVSFTCSRPLLEWAIRQKLAAHSRVQWLSQHRVIGLLEKNQRIVGIKAESLNAGRSTIEHTATLVVDASGRRSVAPKWLAELGFTPPSETVINPFVGYATRRYQIPEDFKHDWKVMLIAQQPPDRTRLGYLAKIENHQWIATLGGYARDFPPLDDAGFLEFAQSLASPRFYEAIASAKPLSPIYAHRATANRWRSYEKTGVPNGFVALGDAVCALCPVYGQGMTVSALSAMVLKDWLEDTNSNQRSSNEFQQRLAKNNQLPWMMAIGQDSRFPTTSGRKQPNKLGALLGWYMEQLIKQTSTTAAFNTLLMEVAHLLKSPAAFYHPKVAAQVLMRSLR